MADQGIISRHNSSVSSTVAYNIDFGTSVQRIWVQALTQDVFVEFNGVANSDSFRVVVGAPGQYFELTGSNVRSVSLLAATSTANVYVLGVVS